ncbi:nuclear transport factor 2 family protein [Lutibacter sp. TH_r2]|uniref:nuclear transport factor 2 family protein n=1 Tax=Lutibacter sp. TH_r2 TaxID=3082083 RepID=UPI0029544836|nr:nuclear transport factor 2 family protein [Lutibacter sp. TH_r2]MDV7186195.1 nuclear transport factor 2 family protein [Lutibacter sp. TH_r2]
MRKISILVVVFCFISCSNSEPKADVIISNEKEVICNVIDTWHKNAAEGNFEDYFSAMTNSSVFIGTDANENWLMPEFKEFSRPYFADGVAWDFKAIDRNVYLSADNKIAWFDELLSTWMGVTRGSGVLVKENDIWKIQHYVLSVTVPNKNVEDVIKINKEIDSLFLKKYQIN